MVDFHSHILPGIDDGSKSIDMSCDMLKKSKTDGVDTVVSTSHCLLSGEASIDDFIKNRNESYDTLKEYIAGDTYPEIRLGAEVALTGDISEYGNLDKLCIEGTNFMLLEMPWDSWNSDTIEFVYNITLTGIQPVMAHIERFFYQKEEYLHNLFEINLLYQINCKGIIDAKSRKIVQKLWENGRVHVIGTDMHNNASRPPVMSEAREACRKHFSKEHWEYLKKNANDILNNRCPDIGKAFVLPKKSGRWFRRR